MISLMSSTVGKLLPWLGEKAAPGTDFSRGFGGGEEGPQLRLKEQFSQVILWVLGSTPCTLVHKCLVAQRRLECQVGQGEIPGTQDLNCSYPGQCPT